MSSIQEDDMPFGNMYVSSLNIKDGVIMMYLRYNDTRLLVDAGLILRSHGMSRSSLINNSSFFDFRISLDALKELVDLGLAPSKLIDEVVSLML